jgi:hypothetical protein
MLSPILVSNAGQKRQWERERKAAEADRISDATLELVKMLSSCATRYAHYAFAFIFQVSASDNNLKDETRYAVLLNAYYEWEMIVSSYLESSEQLDELRTEIEGANVTGLHVNKKAQELANRVLAISRTALQNIN